MDKGHGNHVYNETPLWFLHLHLNIERALASEVRIIVYRS